MNGGNRTTEAYSKHKSTKAKKNEAEARSEFHQAEKVIADYDAGLHDHLYEAFDQIIVTRNDQK